MNIIENFKKYISEVKAEVKKVSWPTKEKAIKDSTIVVVVSLATALFLGGIDYILSYLISLAI